jgi:hypothetical protein
MSFNIPIGANEEMRGSMDVGGGVKLPFPHIFMSFRNGKRDAGKERGEQYFGGFQADEAEFVDYLAAIGKQDVLNSFNLHTLTPRVGDPYQAYMRRGLAVAPIAARSRWFKTREGKNVLKRQVVGLMALGTPLQYVGPVVVTASGYNQAMNLTAAFDANANITANARRQHAAGAAANFFYAYIGTWKEDGEFVMVGKGQNQSPITPIAARSYKVETAEELRALYVGDELAKTVLEYRKQAQEWVDDWNKKRDEKPEQFDTEAPADDIPF